jgi:RNA polymerase sigma factor (sigma-70 family)
VIEPAELALGSLLQAAAAGDELAWRTIVERFHRLVWATARSSGLGEADAADVTQTTWLRLAEHLSRISTPDALPGWLVTTTRREATRVSRRSRRPLPPRLVVEADLALEPPASERIVDAERRREVRAAFERLGERCRMLLALLSADEPLSYEQISAEVEIPVGSIGPTRRRCLVKLAELLDRPRSMAR